MSEEAYCPYCNPNCLATSSHDKTCPRYPAEALPAADQAQHVEVRPVAVGFVIFKSGGMELTFKPNGEVVFDGRLIGTDKEIFEALQEVTKGWSNNLR